MNNEATLYGIKNSNRKSKDFWGKNMFNSSFPVGLANYMRDSNKKAVYITLKEDLTPQTGYISIDEAYNAVGIRTDDLYFAFEHKFTPYEEYSYDPIDGVDLVIKTLSGNFLRPLEVKLTVLPDSATFRRVQEKWGSEIVIRPATTSYCALGIADAIKEKTSSVRKIFEPDCSKIRDWGNESEMSVVLPKVLELINLFEREYIQIQKPFILQPIWKTLGQNPIIAEDAFDIFVWSDLAFTRLFLDRSSFNGGLKGITRHMRSTARLARFLYEFSRSGKVGLNDIYRQMTFDLQTDKEFSANGSVTNKYMSSPRLIKPVVARNELYNIILGGGEELLMPERRFDQSIYFTMKRNS